MRWVQRPVCTVSGGNIGCFYQTRSNRSPHVKEIPRAFTLIDSYDFRGNYFLWGKRRNGSPASEPRTVDMEVWPLGTTR